MPRNVYTLHLPSGSVVVVDPSYLHHAQRAVTSDPLRGPAIYNSEAPAYERLLALETAASGSERHHLEAIGFCELDDSQRGMCELLLNDIHAASHPSPPNSHHAHFSVDTGQVVVFDVEYLSGVFRTFSWKAAYRRNGRVDRKQEREWAKQVGSVHSFVQVQSAGVGTSADFVGDGEYCIAAAAFRPLMLPAASQTWRRMFAQLFGR